MNDSVSGVIFAFTIRRRLRTPCGVRPIAKRRRRPDGRGTGQLFPHIRAAAHRTGALLRQCPQKRRRSKRRHSHFPRRVWYAHQTHCRHAWLGRCDQTAAARCDDSGAHPCAVRPGPWASVTGLPNVPHRASCSSSFTYARWPATSVTRPTLIVCGMNASPLNSATSAKRASCPWGLRWRSGRGACTEEGRGVRVDLLHRWFCERVHQTMTPPMSARRNRVTTHHPRAHQAAARTRRGNISLRCLTCVSHKARCMVARRGRCSRPAIRGVAARHDREHI